MRNILGWKVTEQHETFTLNERFKVEEYEQARHAYISKVRNRARNAKATLSFGPIYAPSDNTNPPF
jgi:hypothetical protein